METAIRIRTFRELKNISREEMSESLGISLNTYAKIEKGTRSPNLKELKLIAKRLEIDTCFLLENTKISNSDAENLIHK